METTVTMSLSEFKEFESDRAVLKEIMSNRETFLIHVSSYGQYIVRFNDDVNKQLVIDLQKAIEQREDVIAKLRRLEK
jgi:hypothetical protein